MKKRGAIFFVFFLVCAIIALNSAWGQEKHFWLNKEVTAKIRAFDRNFFKGFDVYSAGVLDAPTALLFDVKGDDYHLPSPLWGKSLSEAEIIYAIHSLDAQHSDNTLIPFPPRASISSISRARSWDMSIQALTPCSWIVKRTVA